MSTNAYGKDFWIGQVWHSKDKRESARHVVIGDIRSGRAKCHRLHFPNDAAKRGSLISLKNLATRWEQCSPDTWAACAMKRMAE
jgi:hypothetical protein